MSPSYFPLDPSSAAQCRTKQVWSLFLEKAFQVFERALSSPSNPLSLKLNDFSSPDAWPDLSSSYSVIKCRDNLKALQGCGIQKGTNLPGVVSPPKDPRRQLPQETGFLEFSVRTVFQGALLEMEVLFSLPEDLWCR